MIKILPLNEFDSIGIFHYFSINKRSIFDYVQADASSTHEDTDMMGDQNNWSKPHTIIDFKNELKIENDNWCSDNFEKSNFTLSLLRNKVYFTNYSILSRTKIDLHHPTNWIVEGSLDNKTFTQIDEQNNIQDLKGLSKIRTFQVKEPRYVQYIKFTHYGTSSTGERYFSFHKIDIFGYFEDQANSQTILNLSLSIFDKIKTLLILSIC